MNKTLQDFGRIKMLEGLYQLDAGSQFMFKQMYSYKSLDKSLESIVISFPDTEIDWAMQQVEMTLSKERGELMNRNYEDYKRLYCYIDGE